MAGTPLETRTARIQTEADGIVRATVLPGARQTLADAEENMRVQLQLTSNQRHSLLVDLRQIHSQDRDAREYYTQPENARYIRAVAIIIGSPMSRVIGNFLIGFNKSVTPTKLFTSESEAFDWLRAFRD